MRVLLLLSLLYYILRDKSSPFFTNFLQESADFRFVDLLYYQVILWEVKSVLILMCDHVTADFKKMSVCLAVGAACISGFVCKKLCEKSRFFR